MAPPANSTYIVQGEMHIVVMAMKRGGNNKWSSHVYQDVEDPLVRSFNDLKDILNHVSDLSELDLNQFLGPFLEVIRSGDTTGPVTGLALSSINKFLTYGLVDVSCETASSAVENITDAVTHARFVGTDPGSDEVVLMKILQVLRTLMLSPVGILLSNESFCEIMQSCFRICFEMRLSELLRKSAENALVDMTQLLFARLPQFKDDNGTGMAVRKLKMRAGMMDTSRGKSKRKSPRPKHKKYSQSHRDFGTKVEDESLHASSFPSPDSGVSTPHEGVTPVTTPCDSLAKEFVDVATNDVESSSNKNANSIITTTLGVIDMQENLQAASEMSTSEPVSIVSNALDIGDDQETTTNVDYVNPRGVRFTPQQQGRDGPLVPYGLPCMRELFRFLISLINPLDKQNSEVMIHIGLSLLTVALEANASYIGSFPSLLILVKDELCRNLFFLINSERLSLFVASLRVCFLLFEALRSHLKFQLEMYLNKLMAIIMSESQKIPYEQREMVLESLVQLWCIPGLVTELYLNYDCDLYCSNLFEELTKLLSKNAFPMSGLYSTHLLSLDALLAVIDSIENHCHAKVLRDRQTTERSYLSLGQVSDHSKNEVSADTLFSRVAGSTSPLPMASGYLLAQSILAKETCDKSNNFPSDHYLQNFEHIPSYADLVNIKHKKKLLLSGTEQFNTKPSKGIQFLQESGMLSCAADPTEVTNFLKENPRLDKKMIGEFISNRQNLKVLESFVKSFNFEDTRIDEALRMYLETFRLPGEAPVILLIMEHFAEHWHKSNNEPFANSDAAFTLAYAVIMLNVDQHNHNVKKQSIPMTLEEFKKNLTKVNGGQDFDPEMLEEIYISIRNEEIVMPAEQTGLVRENYLWKMLLRRGLTKDGLFIRVPSGSFDRNLFSLIWGPAVAALSFVFDKSVDDAVIQRTISGFRKCAMIAAHYGMSDVFDHLIISLCKFTTLLNTQEASDVIPIIFGGNAKAQLAAKTVFNLTHRHGDILREGWRNVLDCLLRLFNAKLLPKALVEVEDFVNPSGMISLLREETPIQRSAESGIFSSFYSYITLNAEPQVQKGMSPEDEECTERAKACILSCHPEHLISESKFLRADSLQELVKALILASPGPDSHVSHSGTYMEDMVVFLLELLVEIVLHNRDRVNVVWQVVRDHIYGLMMGASATEHLFLMERSVVSILRLAVRLLWREDMTAQVLQSLRMLLLLKPVALLRVSRQIAFALYELIKTNAANIHAAQDWITLFTLLEYIGAGAKPPKILDGTILDSNDSASENGVQSDSEINSETARDSSRSPDRGYTSDSELYDANHTKTSCEVSTGVTATGSWLLIGKEGDIETLQVQNVPLNQYDIVLQKNFTHHDTPAFIKSCESITFLVRDAAHITPENFESCIQCIRTFTEASLNGGRQQTSDRRASKYKDGKERRVGGHRQSSHRKEEEDRFKRSSSTMTFANIEENDDERQKKEGCYHQASVQLLDLMHTLHTKASSILSTSWSNSGQVDSETCREETSGLWSRCWCPLLQGIARLCCDSRRQVRTTAVTYLQRALLVHDLQTLSAVEWEACFNKVLFPLLLKLLENFSPSDPTGVEETRVRGATLLCKVFLQHLTPLLSLPTFTALWLTILDFMDKYMHADKSDLLCEAIPESLKNMLLVMDTAGIFGTPSGSSQLWTITWDRIDTFLPTLKDEVFKSHQRDAVASNASATEATIQTSPVGSPVNGTGQLSPVLSTCVINIEDGVNGSAPKPSLILQTALLTDSNHGSNGSIVQQQQQQQPQTRHVQIANSVPLIVNPAGMIENAASRSQ